MLPCILYRVYHSSLCGFAPLAKRPVVSGSTPLLGFSETSLLGLRDHGYILLALPSPVKKNTTVGRRPTDIRHANASAGTSCSGKLRPFLWRRRPPGEAQHREAIARVLCGAPTAKELVRSTDTPLQALLDEHAQVPERSAHPAPVRPPRRTTRPPRPGRALAGQTTAAGRPRGHLRPWNPLLERSMLQQHRRLLVRAVELRARRLHLQLRRKGSLRPVRRPGQRSLPPERLLL